MTPNENRRWTLNRILAVLRVHYPDWTTDAKLQTELKDEGEPLVEDDLREHLHFLRDWPRKGEGYVELQKITRGGREVKQCRITPLGMLLVERHVPADPQIAEF